MRKLQKRKPATTTDHPARTKPWCFYYNWSLIYDARDVFDLESVISFNLSCDSQALPDLSQASIDFAWHLKERLCLAYYVSDCFAG